MKNFFNFLKGIISTGNDASSKRLFGLWGMFLITAIVTYALIKADVSDVILNIFYALLAFVLSMAGVSSYEAATKHISNNNKDKKD